MNLFCMLFGHDYGLEEMYYDGATPVPYPARVCYRCGYRGGEYPGS